FNFFTFSVAPGSANADQITDFLSGSDKIVLDAEVMDALGASGDFAAGDARFWAAAGAIGGHDADDRVIYNTTTRQIFYDADGSGSGAAQLIATLQSGATLAATDIVVFGSPINGTAGDDFMVGTANPDSMAGGAGNDTLDGGYGNDTLDGGAGNDRVIGREGADWLRGGDGNDTIDGFSSIEEPWGEEYQAWDPNGGPVTFLPGDTLEGGLGDDYYYFQPNDVIVEAGGFDTVEVIETSMTLPDGIEGLVERTSRGNDNGGLTELYGNALDNVIDASWIANILDGGDGNDTIYGGGSEGGPFDANIFRLSRGSGNYGNDELYGEGWDVLDFADARSAFVADLTAGTLIGGGTGGSGTATLIDFEEVIG